MKPGELNSPVVMVRPNLDHFPQFDLPENISTRWFEAGDQRCWLDIHIAAERYRPIEPGLFTEQFGTDAVILAQRQCYLVDPRGAAVGTGTAWFDPAFQEGDYGRIHWLAVRPEWQGRGLGKALLAILCGRLRKLGHRQAFLRTSSVRLPAINLYLQFGFKPLLRSDVEAGMWRGILARLQQ